MLGAFLVFAVAIVSPDAPKPYEVTAANELSAYLKKCVPAGKVTIDAGEAKHQAETKITENNR